MSEPTPTQKMLANVRHLRSKGAPQERIQQEIAFWAPQIQAHSASERKLSGGEQVAGFLSTMGSGATFGGLDEAGGVTDAMGIGSGTMDEQRFLQKQFREENPGVAFGAEVLGSIATPGTFLKPAARAARWGVKAARALGEGAIQGGISAVGNAEGDLTERLDEGLMGAGAGAGVAGAMGGAGKILSRTAGNALERIGWTPNNPQKALEKMADATPDEDIAAGRANLADFSRRRMGEEVTFADVMPQGDAALRVAGTQNREARKMIDTELRQRSNRLSNTAEERFSEYTGTGRQSGDKTVANLIESAKQKGEPHYAAGRQEAQAFDAANPRPVRPTRRPARRHHHGGNEPEVDMDESLRAMQEESGAREIDLDAPPARADDPRAFLAEVTSIPYVRREIARLKADPREAFQGVPDDDHNLLARVYQNLGADIRDKTISAADRRDFIGQREKLRRAMGERSPEWLKGNEEFAGEMALKDAYETGATKNTPADMIPSEMADLTPGEMRLYREGKASTLRPRTANADLGEYARFRDVLDVFSDPEKSRTFRATFGEDKYRAYLSDLLAMAKLQRMKGGAGESTTVDKMMEQMEADPEKVASLVRSLGNPLELFAQASRWDKVLGRLNRSKQAKENASFMLTRGEDKVQQALDLLEKLRKEGKLPGDRKVVRRRPNASATTARLLGGEIGRP